MLALVMLAPAGRRGPMLCALLVVTVLAASATAFASAGSSPVLKSPRNGQAVRTGAITLIVEDPDVPAHVRPVYAQISRQRKLDKYGHLVSCIDSAHGCEFVALHPWKHHPGYWIYTTNANFPGYWAVTPGKYYWQTQHVAPLCQAPGCEVASAIHWFRVVA
jgi:hypothetical protein